jgi:hypothetical protein
MNKKYFVLGGVLLFVLLVLFFIFSGKEKEDSSAGVPDMKAMAGKINDAEIQKIVDDIALLNEDYKETLSSSVEKINDAYFSGKIKAEEYALLSVRALYGDPSSLPEAYRGEKDSAKDHAFLFGLIHSKWKEFSIETKEKLSPFLISPKDPKSYFNLNKSEGEQKDILQKMGMISAANAEMDFGTIEASPNVKVNYAGEDQKKAAEWVAEAIRDALPRYRSFFGMEYKPTDVTIVESRDLDADGQAKMSETEGAPAGQCDILVRAPQDEKGIKTTTVHEWFHCHQFWMNLVYEKPETMWLMEATATWSEDYVYHSFASEHKYDPWFFAKTDLDLLSVKGDHEYALYLWFYFLVQQSQGDPTHVYRALRSGVNNKVKEEMASLEDFTHIHRDFALWNWNRKPFARYVDEPFFPAVTPFYKSVKRETISSNKETFYPIVLEKGAMTYHMIFFPNESVKKIEFNPSKFTGSDEKSMRGLQALYKVNGEWLYEDWTGVKKRTFCRELPEENIEMVVLIANNAELNGVANGNIPITTEKKCGSGWRGTVSVNWQKQNKMAIGSTVGTYTEKGEYHISEMLEYEPEYDNLLVAQQQYFAKFESSQNVEDPSKDCGQMWKRDTRRYSGSGSIDFKKTDNMPERANGEGNEDMNELGGVYLLNFEMFGAPKEYGNKFSGVDISSVLNKDCSFGMIPQANGLKTEQYKTGSNDFTYEPVGKNIEIDGKAKSFSGSEKFEFSGGVFGTVKWNYVRVE